MTNELEPGVGNPPEHAWEDALGEPERGVGVRMVREAADEEDGWWVSANGVQRPWRNVDGEWDPQHARLASGRRHCRNVAVCEDHNRVKLWARHLLVAAPRSDLEPTDEAARALRHLEQIIRPRRPRVVVDEDPREVPPRRGVDILGHHLQVDLDDVGAPLVEQPLERGAVVGAEAVGCPRPPAAPHADSPGETAPDAAVV